MSERSRSSCESWLAASIPSAVSLFLGHSAMAETSNFDRMTTSGGRTTLGGQATPLDVGEISVERGVRVLLEGSVEYHISNGVCTFTSSGSYSAATEPSHGMLTYDTLDHTVQSGDACNGHTFPYAVVYYTWTDDQPGATQDSFAVQWRTPDGTAGGPYDYTVELNEDAATLAFNGEKIASSAQPVSATQTVTVGQQISLTASPLNGHWTREDGNPIKNFTPTLSSDPRLYSCEPATCTPPATFSGSAATFYWYVPSKTESSLGTYSVAYSYTNNDGTSGQLEANFVVVSPIDAPVSNPVSAPTLLLNKHKSPVGFFSNATLLSCGVNRDPNPSLPCVIFNAPNSSLAGDFEWIQLLHYHSATYYLPDGQTRVFTTGGEGTDGKVPYGGGPLQSVNDAPGNGLASCTTRLDISFGAAMYLLWKSAIPGSIYVPLGSTEWTWNATAERGNLEENWHLVPFLSFPAAAKFNPTSGYPYWDREIPSGNNKNFCPK